MGKKLYSTMAPRQKVSLQPSRALRWGVSLQRASYQGLELAEFREVLAAHGVSELFAAQQPHTRGFT
jgi:hypothetical protein